jgi:hypothetical protein
LTARAHWADRPVLRDLLWFLVLPAKLRVWLIATGRLDPRLGRRSRVFRAWIALGWLLRRAGCFAVGHRWPGPLTDAEAARFGRRASEYGPSSWQRCYRCDLYRHRSVAPVGAWTYGRGKLPWCGLPAMNPWTRVKRAPKGVVRG